MFLLDVIEQLTIYGGFFVLIIGVIGNSINIFIFLTEKNYRQVSASFLFLVGSINDVIYLLFNLTLRVLSTGFEIETFDKYVIVCKIRSYLILALSLISFTCYCLASINQFLSTSRHARLRQYSQIKWTYRVLSVLTLIWILQSIPEYLSYDIPSTVGVCMSVNVEYDNYATIAFFVFLVGLPVLVLIIFGYLSHRNIHQIRTLANQQADHQLTTMTIMQAGLICFSTIPYGIFYAYTVITAEVAKDLDRLLLEYLIGTIVILNSYLHFAVYLLFLNIYFFELLLFFSF